MKTGTSGALALFDLFDELRDNLKDITHHTQISKLEDGRFRVFVNRNDHLGALHPSKMLDRS